ncbi:MAG: peptidylprolyl isomerase [Anaerolineae bacterium]
MRIKSAAWVALLFLGLAMLAACSSIFPADDSNAQPPPTDITNSDTPVADSDTPVPTRPAQTNYCKNGGAVAVSPDEPLAAKVNGQGIPLSLYQREADQEKAALLAQGLDPTSKNGQDAIKGLQEQVIGQLIDNVLVEQAAQRENVTVTTQDVDNRIQQMIDEAGGRAKFDDYLKSTQITLDNLCVEIRSSAFGEVMLARVTAAIPTQVEQVHAAHILLASQADADKVLAQLKAGKSFADLAKQFSKDEATRDSGGDLGWLPKGMMPPEFEAVAFQLQPGQTSGIVSSALGFHIIQVLGHESARDLSPEMLQNQKQQAFLAWLDAQRNQAKIEKLINP